MFAQPAARGALPQLYAAVAPEAQPARYYGPNLMFGAWGWPTEAAMAGAATDPEAASRLWEVSVRLTGERFASLENSR